MTRQKKMLFSVVTLVFAVSAVLASVPLLIPPTDTESEPHAASEAPPIENVENETQLVLSEDEEFMQNLKQQIRSNVAGLEKLDDQQFEQYLHENHKVTSDFINTYLAQETISLYSPSRAITSLNYTFDSNKLDFNTTAEYYPAQPDCKGDKLDFEILAASNFGLRGYCIRNDSVIREFGEYNTAYFSTCYDPQNDLVAFAIRGLFRIDIYNRSDWSLVRSIDNIAASSIEFYRGDLFIGGYKKDGEWFKSSIFQYSVDKGEVTNEFFSTLLADVRGLSFHDGLMAISDSYHNRIIMHDLNSGKTRLLLKGFYYPNGIHLISRDRIYVADEHHHHIRLIDLASMREIWKSPAGQLKAPCSIHQVQQGKWMGMLLISDTDNNRMIVVEPETWKIIYEVASIRGVLKSVPIFRSDTR